MPIASPAALLATVATLAMQAGISPRPAARHTCWIDRVDADGAGVRVSFVPSAPGGLGGTSVRGEPGARLSPANSGHDGCSITVAKRGKALGVQVEAFLFVPHVMPEPDVQSEWIEAADGRNPREGSVGSAPLG